MLFSSAEFILFFLPTVIIAISIVQVFSKSFILPFLLFFSFIFYSFGGAQYLPLLALSILVNYLIGNLLIKNRQRLILIGGIVFNLGLLAYYKYGNFLLDIFSGVTNLSVDFPDTKLPLAISFFTFQQIAYIVDSYNQKSTRCNFLEYSLFVTFFPQLIAGPIVKEQEILENIQDKKIQVTIDNITLGVSLFTLGLFKKVVFADGYAAIADPIFQQFSQSNPDLSTNFLLLGMFAYTLQIYFDFSGYTDMAIGLGHIFGFSLPINFNSPYKSSSIIDFWRRWHITLSNFLRDYIYFPLGGSRKGISRKYINLLIVMLLGGLWHGAGFNFIIWGGIHGVLLVINHSYNNQVKEYLSSKLNQTISWIGPAITFIAVSLAWIPFRLPGLQFIDYYNALFSKLNFDIVYSNQYLFVILGILICWIAPNSSRIFGLDGSNSLWKPKIRFALLTAFIYGIALIFVLEGEPYEFIYFEF
ncbi:MBOAT family protein [Geitlerinema sp. PCC 7407]|uniref:MBOAT family O-acyltransferase n=1 Tax=Geitlerinema sp. PCC 7407 TaxID=1173025 RepID=UPI00029FD875|nr:MBOAT family O-acyltransferase [Geitlerinema sp. PCC 7407]AFY67909.1 membrane bound O-acyl transferase MBOAT family protein [Geitlerinema sp. PCC 7407]